MVAAADDPRVGSGNSTLPTVRALVDGGEGLTKRICVFGLWNLGTVTAACLAAEGHAVIGLDPDPKTVNALLAGRPPVAEPGLSELLVTEMQAGRLSFTHDAAQALGGTDLLWVTFDTPVDEDDRADAEWVEAQLDRVRPMVNPGTLILISSQVPVGFARRMEQAWRRAESTLHFASIPENLRLGQALERFRRPDRVVIGLGEDTPREPMEALFEPMKSRIEWMSLESAEMSKHALNGFLALSATYANELARLCERVGADASEVERALRADSRVGAGAYVAPSGPVGGGTLVRDVAFLRKIAHDLDVSVPMLDAMPASNQAHQNWTYNQVEALLVGIACPRVAILGLTYKPGTNTLRRSTALELCAALSARGVEVRAFDPAIDELPDVIPGAQLRSRDGALSGADVAVLMTAWPEFKTIQVTDLVGQMRRCRVVDQTGFLSHLAADPRVQYVRVGTTSAKATGDR